MSEELNIALTYATFQGMSIKLQSVGRAIEEFDASILEAFAKIRELTPKAPVEEPAAKATVVKTEAETSAGKRTLNARKAAKRIGEQLKQRAVIEQTPLFHFAVMVSDSMRSWIANLPESIMKDK
eukprot:3354127-Pyramimonas_sp.AAC.1